MLVRLRVGWKSRLHIFLFYFDEARLLRLDPPLTVSGVSATIDVHPARVVASRANQPISTETSLAERLSRRNLQVQVKVHLTFTTGSLISIFLAFLAGAMARLTAAATAAPIVGPAPA